ncbi:MAG TPA: hypothetical protein EYH40_04920, partial [Desulfurococcales archaeon]|nr:hypothetical protein [Desulfurococcales archaeon]
MVKRILKTLFISTLLTLILTSLTSVIATPLPNSNVAILSELGITVKTGVCEGEYRELKIAIPEINLVRNGEFITVSVGDDSLDSGVYYLSEPGKPRLPFKYTTLTFNGKVRVKGVEVVDVVFTERKLGLGELIEPSPKPVPYIIGYNISSIGSRVLDESVYNSNSYYPGKLFSYYTGYGFRGKTYIILWVYPVQYNPVTGSLLEVEELTLRVYIERVDASSSSKSSTGEGRVLILTSEKLIDVALEYRNVINELTGLNVTITTVEWIYEHIPPAENITMYPGFYTYTPLYTVKGVKDPYEDLVKYYNWTLALKVINYLRDETLDLEYIIILGSAKTVPPSFYYLSFDNFWYWPYQGWVPTDIFYASPDYDLIPNYCVGRIPFDNPEVLKSYLIKIIDWYKITLGNPSWVKRVALFGGFPFRTSFLFGESALGRIVNEGFLASFNVTLHTRTDGTYTKLSASKVFEGGFYAWALYILHGTGDAIVDYNIVDDKFTIEWIMDSRRLLTLKYNRMLPIVTSVACTNAAWDTEILNPLEYMVFIPPSFGQAILMSPAGGVAYIGFSRIAWELGLKFKLYNGVFKPEFYGAAWLLSLLYRTYTEMSQLKNYTSLGEIASYTLLEYLKTAGEALRGRYQSLMVLTVMEFTLLGDPTLRIPLFKPPEKIKNIEKAVLEKYRQLVSALIILAYPLFVEGEIPYYKAPIDVVETSIASPAEKVRAYVIKILQVRFSGSLMGLKVVDVKDVKVVDGKAQLTVRTSRDVSGFIVLRLKSEMGDLRLYLVSYGLTVKPSDTAVGSPVFIEGYGLNVVFDSETPIALEYAGRFLTLVFIDREGYFNKTIALPMVAPGEYTLTAYAFTIGMRVWIPRGITLPPTPSAKLVTRGIGALDINIAYSYEYKPGEKANITIVTLYKGTPVDSEVKAKLITPDGREIPLKVIPCGKGIYYTTFLIPDTEGSYILHVE